MSCILLLVNSFILFNCIVFATDPNLFTVPQQPANSTGPEANFTVPQEIAYYKYPIEIHEVTTADGYILEVHRIPRGRDERPAPFSNGTRPVVLMMYGIFCDSLAFVQNPPALSGGYVLADAGFDVWLGNVRGTKYGLKHVTMKPNQKEFWNFSWYEHAFFDMPAILDYALSKGGQSSAYYVGHNQGSVEIFARLAEDAGLAFAKKIRAVFALGPIGGLNKTMPALVQFSKANINVILSVTCLSPFDGAVVCPAIFRLFLDIGEQLGQFNESRSEIYAHSYSASTSVLNVMHWAQIVRSHALRRFDYGEAENLKLYKQKTPPEFNLTKITTPTYLYYSKDDTIADAIDVREFVVKKYGPGLKGNNCVDHFTHPDFVIGMRAIDVIYRPIIQTMYEDLKQRSNSG